MSENYNIVEGRIQHKNDIEANWKKAVNFIPLEAEIVIYLPDEEHKTARIKVGDGITNVNDLPFSHGKDGYTPVKGVDYFTEADKQAMVQEVLNSLPDGDGVEY